MQYCIFVHNKNCSYAFFKVIINGIDNIRKYKEKQMLLQHSHIVQRPLHLLLFLDLHSHAFQSLVQRTRNGSSTLSYSEVFPVQVCIWQRTFIISLKDAKENICLLHTKPRSAPCLKRVSENWQLAELIILLVILLPSDVLSPRELLICFSRNEKSFASICTRNVQPTHLGNDSFDFISQFFSLSLLHFNSL